MSTTMRESSHVSRKYVTHGGGAISGQGHSGNASGNSLENNLDALLEDLQTSVSRSVTPSRGGRARSPQVEYRSAANTSKTVSEIRSISPTRSKTTTTEKYVSTGPIGVGSGIPGLKALDAELRNVQPGQTKTVAYKQVSYGYKKDLDGNPIDSYALSNNSLTSGGVPLIEDIHEVSYDERNLHRRHRSPEPAIKTSTVNRELLFDDSYSTARSKQTSPLPGSRDLKFVRESSKFQTDVWPVHSQPVNTREEYGNVEYIPVPSPSPAVPINLAPGPNTKVTTTVKTYTYELPGAPETYLPGTTSSTLQKNVHLAGDQTITYTLPRGASLERPVSPVGYGVVPPTEITQKSNVLHKEAKYYQEEIHGYPPGVKSTTTYSTRPPPPTNLETTLTRNEYYRQTDGTFPNEYGWPNGDRPDHPETSTTTVVYQNQQPPPPATINETHTTTMIDRIEEHYPNRPTSAGHLDGHKPGTPMRNTTVNYYTSPPETTPPQSNNTTIYKYSNTTTIIPPSHHPEDHEVLLPKPFPTGLQLYPANGKPSGPPSNGQGPPVKLEDLMASFSDSERAVLDDIAKKETYQRKERSRNDAISPKKEVDFVPHSPPQVQSKNVAGPPVYYPPGSAEFTKKECAEGVMSQSGGGWQKASGKYEYEASSKSKSKSSSGKAVVPVCLPLCCALPCVIM